MGRGWRGLRWQLSLLVALVGVVVKSGGIHASHGASTTKPSSSLPLRPIRFVVETEEEESVNWPAMKAIQSLTELLSSMVRVDGSMFRGRHPGVTGRCVDGLQWEVQDVPQNLARFASSCRSGLLPPVCRNTKGDECGVPGRLWARHLVCPPNVNGVFDVSECHVASPGVLDAKLSGADVIVFAGPSTTRGTQVVGGEIVQCASQMKGEERKPWVVSFHIPTQTTMPSSWHGLRGNALLQHMLVDGWAANVLGLRRELWPFDSRFDQNLAANSVVLRERDQVVELRPGVFLELDILPSDVVKAFQASARHGEFDQVRAPATLSSQSSSSFSKQFEELRDEEKEVMVGKEEEEVVVVVVKEEGEEEEGEEEEEEEDGLRVAGEEGLETAKVLLEEDRGRRKGEKMVKKWTRRKRRRMRERRLEDVATSNSTTNTTTSLCPPGAFFFNFTLSGDNATEYREAESSVDPEGICVRDCAAHGGPGWFSEAATMECKLLCAERFPNNITYLQPFFSATSGLSALAGSDAISNAQDLCVSACPFGSIPHVATRTCSYTCDSGSFLHVGGDSSQNCTSDCSEISDDVFTSPFTHSVPFPLHRACYATNCSSNGTFEDPASGDCVETCPVGTVQEWPQRECSYVCAEERFLPVEGQRLSSITAAQETCRATCPVGEVEDVTHRRCNAFCPPGTVLPASVVRNATDFHLSDSIGCTGRECCDSDGDCEVGYSAGSNRVCSKVCDSDDFPFLLQSTQSSPPLLSFSSSIATASESDICVANCSASGAGMVGNDAGVICEPFCGANTHLLADTAETLATEGVSAINASDCVSDPCPYGQALLSIQRVCAFQCEEGEYLSPRGRDDLYEVEECVTTCPRGYDGNDTSRTCVRSCEDDDVIMPWDTSGDCVSGGSCPFGYEADIARVCIPICASGLVMPAQGKSEDDCVSSCPAGEVRNGTERYCIVGCETGTYLPPGATSVSDCVVAASCPYGTSASPTTQRCKIACPDPTFLPAFLEDLLDDDPGNVTQAREECATSCPKVSLRGTSNGSYSYAVELTRACEMLCGTSDTFLHPWPAVTGVASSCLRTCPRGSSGNVQYRVCQPACLDGYLLDLDDICRTSCSVGWNPADVPDLVSADVLSRNRACVLNTTNAPVWSSTSTVYLSIGESTGAGHTVGSDFSTDVSDDDGNLDTIEFYVVGGSGDSLFVIEDPSVGQLMVGANVTLDYESNVDVDGEELNYTVIVEARDLNGNAAQRTFVIGVTDDNEIPEIALSYKEALVARGYGEDEVGRFVYGTSSEVVIPMGAMIVDVDASDRDIISTPSVAQMTLTYTLEWYNTENSAYESLSTMTSQFKDSTLDIRTGRVYNDEFILGGAPFYSGAPSLQQSPVSSPSSKTFTFRLTGTDHGGLAVSTTFEISVVIGGCRSPSAAWDATTNPNGNYNPVATVSTDACIFPSTIITGESGGDIVLLASDGSATGEGAVSISFPPGAIASGTSLNISVEGGQTLLDNGLLLGLNPTQTRRRSLTLLYDNMLHLGPEGATFSEPVTIRFTLGELASGTSAMALTASRASTSLPYGYFEAISNCTIVASTGTLTCKLYHFSIVIPSLYSTASNTDNLLLVDLGSSSIGSCPNNCHGNGRCGSHSRCACWPGFTGYDCRQRSCPKGPTWGEASLDAERGKLIGTPNRAYTECSGRGTCNRDSGKCHCFDGFEGGACQRMGCARDSTATTLSATSLIESAIQEASQSVQQDRRHSHPSSTPRASRVRTAAKDMRSQLRSLASTVRSKSTTSPTSKSSSSSSSSPPPSSTPSASTPSMTSSLTRVQTLHAGSHQRTPMSLARGNPPCSGHGECLPISSLSSQLRNTLEYAQVHAVGTYSGWDEDRIMTCQCDPGFEGPDCSWRKCPHGNDKFTPCDRSDPSGPPCDPSTTAQVWRVSLTLPTVPASESDVEGEFALMYGVLGGDSRWTPRVIGNIWEMGAITSAEAMRLAIEETVGDEVLVETETRTSTERSWLVTFTSVPGNVNLLRCPPRMGCDTPGCNPRFQQLRFIDTSLSTGNTSHIQLTEGRIVPTPTTGSGHSDALFDLRIVLTISYTTEPTSGNSRPIYSIRVTAPSSSGTVLVEEDFGPLPLGRPIPLISDDTTSDITSGTELVGEKNRAGARGIPIGIGNLAFDTLVDTPAAGTYIWLASAATCTTERARAAHPRFASVECSGRGSCNHDTGLCVCDPGYTTQNCGEMIVEL